MSGESEIAELRAAILLRHKTIYAFCKANKGRIGKSVVVLVLAGKYPGNTPVQIARIWALLQSPPAENGINCNDIVRVLGQVACERCTRKRKRKACHACRDLWQAQALAIHKQ